MFEVDEKLLVKLLLSREDVNINEAKLISWGRGIKN
jgi:hypothetical protein